MWKAWLRCLLYLCWYWFLLALPRCSCAFLSDVISSSRVQEIGNTRSLLHMTSTIDVVKLSSSGGGGHDIRLRHQLQIGGLEAEGDLTGLKLWPTTAVPLFQRLRKTILGDTRKKRSQTSTCAGSTTSNTCTSRPLRILELGSGCGVLGIGVASLGEEVVLTDPAVPFHTCNTDDPKKEQNTIDNTTLQWLDANIGLNSDILDGRATARKLYWGNADDMDDVEGAGPFDLVIGSELLYYAESFPGLLATIRRFGKGGVPVLLAYKTRRLGESKFLASAEEYFDISIERLGRKGQDLFLAECLIKE